jgi:hypothetical protein
LLSVDFLQQVAQAKAAAASTAAGSDDDDSVLQGGAQGKKANKKAKFSNTRITFRDSDDEDEEDEDDASDSEDETLSQSSRKNKKNKKRNKRVGDGATYKVRTRLFTMNAASVWWLSLICSLPCVS